MTLADKDHVFLDFQPKHTSLTVWNMFKGFSGYVQADAHVIYDALFKGVAPKGADDEPAERGPPPLEVGCFSHVRRKYWEAAVCRHPLGLEGVHLIDAIFAADRKLADLAPRSARCVGTHRSARSSIASSRGRVPNTPGSPRAASSRPLSATRFGTSKRSAGSSTTADSAWITTPPSEPSAPSPLTFHCAPFLQVPGILSVRSSREIRDGRPARFRRPRKASCTSGRSRSAARICHGASKTTCFAGKIPLRTKRRIAWQLTPAFSAASTIVRHRPSLMADS